MFDVADRLAHLIGVFATGLVIDEVDDLAEGVLDLLLVLSNLFTRAVAQLAGELAALLDDVIGVHLGERSHACGTGKGSWVNPG